MAIDLNRPIGAPAAASTALPTKRTINLLVRESKGKGAWRYVLAALGLAALVALFAKFAVFDVNGQVDQKRTELAAVQAELDAVQKQLESFDAVQDEYRSYTGIASEGALDALQVMDLVARVIEPAATVTSASTSDGLLAVNVKDISLDNLGKLADTLRSEDLVTDVVVTGAADDDEDSVTATLQVALAGQDAQEGE